MHRHPSIHRLLLSGTFTLLAGMLAPSAFAASATPSVSAAPVATTASNALAAGASEDSLQACLARIPKDATTGQRMVAEQSCRRDEGDRKPFQANPSR